LPGSGKTIAALAYLEAIENSFGNNFSNYFIFSKRQIIANTWKEDKNSFFAEKISHKLSYFAFDDVVQLRQAIFAIQQISTNPESKRALIIFDEFHHLMKTVINNEVSDLAVSDKVKKRNLNQLKSNLYFIMLSSANLNFLLMSGTPIYQEAFELCLQ
jgi:superfamily II DNA or RNA helicase